MTEPARIIIVEDEVPLARAIARSLELDGHHTALAPSAAEFRRIYRNEGADLVLLDLNLGADDGLDLARELAQTTAVAVIILTGRADPDERIRGLDAGADDYVTKPFEVGELRARVRAVLRRRRPVPSPELRLRVGPVVLDLVMREVRSDGGGQPVELTETQADILAQLMRHVGRPVGRGDLLHRANWGPNNRSADVHVGHIRRKLEEAGIDALVIAAARGCGYGLFLKGEEGAAQVPEADSAD
ncbi:response regulator transcription factor [uncultured Thiodictyon sp.]|jgi:DNA-binding response OmpR family regulator|uniref:response regulator transcription factor n=1 Tax=uncultured Thiodictyon sp. TaxID=1846217 RepID=UPI0025DAD486|nr:response regulator transcription factor [uncultured Thiodictyon sp.]